MDTHGISNYHTKGEVIDLTKLTIIKLMPCEGGSLIIKELPEYPPVECNADNCDEFATYCCLMASRIPEDHCLAFTCEEHKDKIIDLILENMSVIQYH